MGLLSTSKILRKFKRQFSRKLGSKFFGAGHSVGIPYIRNHYIAFCGALWAVKTAVEILSISTSGLQ